MNEPDRRLRLHRNGGLDGSAVITPFMLWQKIEDGDAFGRVSGALIRISPAQARQM